jgi:glutathione S-transferase
MQLIGSPTSPYVRKVRVYLEETGAPCARTLPPGFTPVA